MPSIEKFAVILYTVRDHIKTREDAVKTFDKLAEIGFQSVQVSGMDATLFPPEELKQVLADHGLSICATHENSNQIRKETENVISRLKALGTTYTAYPFPGGVDFKDTKSIDSLILDLNAAGAKMAAEGITLCYHNHHQEFYHNQGKPILARIYEETDPANLKGELDTFWVQRGGGCVISWIEKLYGRLPLLHLKDYKLDDDFNAVYTEIGNGNLNFPGIIAAAEKAGCQHFIVEQDTCPGSPFDSLTQSFEYIKANLVS